MRLIRRYSFAAAHVLGGLPEDHPCSRLHGHGYEFEVTVFGEPDSRGMLIEYADLDALVASVLARYDHRYLNDFMAQPTVENIAQDIWTMLYVTVANVEVRVWETPRSSAIYP